MQKSLFSLTIYFGLKNSGIIMIKRNGEQLFWLFIQKYLKEFWKKRRKMNINMFQPCAQTFIVSLKPTIIKRQELFHVTDEAHRGFSLAPHLSQHGTDLESEVFLPTHSIISYCNSGNRLNLKKKTKNRVGFLFRLPILSKVQIARNVSDRLFGEWRICIHCMELRRL